MGRKVMLNEVFSPGDVLSDQERSGFVPVGFAETPHEAERWKMMLEAHEIPALIEGQRGRSTEMPRLSRSVPVLVPDDCLDEASSLVKRMEFPGLTVRFAKDAIDEEEDDELVFDDDDEDDDEDDDIDDDLDDDLDDDPEEEFDDDLDDDEDDLAFGEEV